jgi:hypothetical protein
VVVVQLLGITMTPEDLAEARRKYKEEEDAFNKKEDELLANIPEEVADWLAFYHGKYRELTMTEWVRNYREEKKNG